MINFNEKLLEKSLFEQFLDSRGVDSSNENYNKFYLVVESIDFLTEDSSYDGDDYNKCPCVVKLRYGVEDTWCNHTELFLYQTWTQDFIKGYFQKHLEDIDERGENQ